jgi:hypothetical protein
MTDETFPPPGGWQGASGPMTEIPLARAQELRDTVTALRAELAAAPVLIAAEINRLARASDGTWLSGGDFIAKLGPWLEARGADPREPDERTDCHEDCTWPAGPHTDWCITDPGGEAPVLRERQVNLAAFHVDHDGDPTADPGRARIIVHGDCGRTVCPLDLGSDVSELLDVVVAHGLDCPGQGAVTVSPDGDGGLIIDTGQVVMAAPVNRAAQPPGGGPFLPGDVQPPRSWVLRERAGWTAAYALTVQVQLTGGHPGLVFHGIPGGLACDVAIELDGGTYLTTLVNPGAGYMKSPTGFGVGGLGSGCAALAHALIVAALGRWAVCTDCAGTGKTTVLVDGEDRPWQEGDDPEAVVTCFDCDGWGIAVSPRVYQRFKEQVISPIDAGTEWRISRARILTWLADQDADPDLAAAAVAAAIHYEGQRGEVQ